MSIDKPFNSNIPVSRPRVELFLTRENECDGAPTHEKVLEQRIDKLERINRALIRRVERGLDGQAGGYALFQSAILLEEKVRSRTLELRQALNEIEATNEDLSLAKEQAEELNAGKTKFIAAASHDLLQPLSAARLNMSALKTEQASRQAENLILQIDRSLKTIEELLRTLFDISKLDTGVHVPEICRYPAERIIRSLFSDFSAVASQNKLSLKIYPCEIYVDTDPLFLRRILQNLVSNALRYTETGGVLIGCRQRRGYLRFEVWDTGAGIPLSEQDKIFDEFHRCPGHTMREGLGLGLSIVKRMADSLGHEIEFCSREGQGSKFAVSAPLSADQSRSSTQDEVAPISPTLSHRFEKSHVVVIEDEPSLLEAMTSLLERMGMTCIGGESINAVLNKLEENGRQPDLIIADYHLTGDTRGHQAVIKIRETVNHHIPAIIVTADPSDETRSNALLNDCEFLTKPIEPGELRALMAHLIM